MNGSNLPAWKSKQSITRNLRRIEEVSRYSELLIYECCRQQEGHGIPGGLSCGSPYPLIGYIHSSCVSSDKKLHGRLSKLYE